MFRTARGFLLLAPIVFVAGVISYLAGRPHAAESFTVYPFLSEVLGESPLHRPVSRFLLVATLFFAGPYLAAGALLSLSDLSLSSARMLWRGGTGDPRRDHPQRMPTESLVALVGVSLLAAAILGWKLRNVVHGGELPGGVNVSPVFVAAVPFAALGAGLVAAVLASIPRAARRLVVPGAAPPGR